MPFTEDTVNNASVEQSQNVYECKCINDHESSKNTVHRALHSRPTEPDLGWTFLLDPSPPPAPSSVRSFGPNPSWTFSSPLSEWSISSFVLLSIDYRRCIDVNSSQGFPKAAGRRLISGASPENETPAASATEIGSLESLRRDYLASEVLWNELDEAQIKGIGKCMVLRVGLPMITTNTKERNRNWHCGDDRSNHIVVEYALQQFNGDAGCDSPPLSWRVSIPPITNTRSSSTSIQLPPSFLIDNLTVLDGTLDVDKNACYGNEGGPSHIYCNGWQSWSFAGTVPRCMEQPRHAMPNIFAGEFHRGGAVPSAPKNWWDTVARGPPPVFYTSDAFACITCNETMEGNANSEAGLLDESGGPACVLGWISQHHQFGVVAADDNLKRIAMHAEVDGVLMTNPIQTDWAWAQIVSPHCYDHEPMAGYLDAVADYVGVMEKILNTNHPRAMGWCSWYHFYEEIDEKKLVNNVASLAKLQRMVNSNMCIVDDGYQTAWGDWDSIKPNKFEMGMRWLAKEIQNAGCRPGLWLAPFACDKHSELALRHPEWIIRNDRGVPANSANCGKFFYGLDATIPEVREHVKRSVKRAVEEWGFTVLKLDFLYAACLPGVRYDNTKSRAEALHLALTTLREAAGPKTFIIGCGCPLATAVGIVDSMRVSADTGPTWAPPFPFPWWDQANLPCLRSMIRNSINRMCLSDRWWYNDPDCLLLRETTSLTLEEIRSAATVAAFSGGMVLLSDDLPALDKTRVEIITKISPLTGAAAIPLDMHLGFLPSILRLMCSDIVDVDIDHKSGANCAKLHDLCRTSHSTIQRARRRNRISVCPGLGSWNIVALCNWSDAPAVVRTPISAMLPPLDLNVDDCSYESGHSAGYHVFAFWSSRYIWIPERTSEEKTFSKKLNAHDCEIFHVKSVDRSKVQYVGSSLHYSCGFEVKSIENEQNGAKIFLKNDLSRDGHVYLFLPNFLDCEWNINGHVCSDDSVEHVMSIPLYENNLKSFSGRVVRVRVTVMANGRKDDGIIIVRY